MVSLYYGLGLQGFLFGRFRKSLGMLNDYVDTKYHWACILQDVLTAVSE